MKDEKREKPHKKLFNSPRVKSLLYAGASLCTTLCYVAMMSPKRPESAGE